METKQILFKLKLQGNGVVNFDSKEQKYMLYKTDNGPAYEILKNDNGKFAKKSFVQIGEKEDGTPLYHSRLKISSNCLRHAIFEKDSPITLSQALVTQNDELFAFFVALVTDIAVTVIVGKNLSVDFYYKINRRS